MIIDPRQHLRFTLTFLISYSILLGLSLLIVTTTLTFRCCCYIYILQMSQWKWGSWQVWCDIWPQSVQPSKCYVQQAYELPVYPVPCPYTWPSVYMYSKMYSHCTTSAIRIHIEKSGRKYIKILKSWWCYEVFFGNVHF